jgi:hypothetical protein
MPATLPHYELMHPMLVREPFHRDGWVYEEKVDGWRVLSYKDGERVRLISRNGRDHTRRFADLAAAVAKLSARTLVLDDEVAIYDQQLRSEECPARSPPPAGVTTRSASIAGSLVRFVGLSLQERPESAARRRRRHAVQSPGCEGTRLLRQDLFRPRRRRPEQRTLVPKESDHEGQHTLWHGGPPILDVGAGVILTAESMVGVAREHVTACATCLGKTFPTVSLGL